jgi:hypothetical protein
MNNVTRTLTYWRRLSNSGVRVQHAGQPRLPPSVCIDCEGNQQGDGHVCASDRVRRRGRGCVVVVQLSSAVVLLLCKQVG